MPDKNIVIGEKVKSLRTLKKMSLEDVAQKSGLPVAVIAGIEDQSVSPPLGNIITLANLFQVTVGEFFGDSADSPFCIVRGDDRKAVSRFNSTVGTASNYSYESLGHQKQNRRMEPFHVTLSPVKTPQVEPNQHAGEEIIFVLEGQVEVNLANHTDVLNPGDSIYFDSNLPHIVSCHGDKPASIFAVIYAEQKMIIF